MAGALLTQLFTWIAPRVIPCLEVLYINHLYLHSICNFLRTRIQRYLFHLYKPCKYAEYKLLIAFTHMNPLFQLLFNRSRFCNCSESANIFDALNSPSFTPYSRRIEGNMIGPWQSKWVGKNIHCINHWISEQSTKLEPDAEHILYPALNKSKRSEHIWHFRESNRLESFQIRTHLGDRATHWS